MLIVSRILSGLIGLVAAAQFLRYALVLDPSRPDFLVLIFLAVTGAVAFFGLWFAIRAGDPEVRARTGSALKGGIILGFIGFVGGFVGPMILTPDANQGPLLGIFITGPMGFFAGLVGGYLRAWLR